MNCVTQNNGILKASLNPDQAELCFLGQAGYIMRTADCIVVIDPYLTDSVGLLDSRFTRLYPPPIQPEELKADIFVVTHDHLDHLDPETIRRYQHTKETCFVAPRLACRNLRDMGVPKDNIYRLDAGESQTINTVRITGIYAVPSAPEVIDTTGYHIAFSNGRTVYATSDTGFSDLLLACAPAAEVMLVCINGKWGNLSAEQAARLTGKVAPRFVMPNHYDMMALNTENPETFKCFLHQHHPNIQTRFLKAMETFVWS